MRYAIWICLLLAAGVCRGADDWQLPAWRYRVPVQVYNLAGTPKSGLLLAVRDLPTTALLSDGKLNADGSDFRLLDGRGVELPIRPELLKSDSGDAQVGFFLKDLSPRGKARLWLYYGNPNAKYGEALRPDEVVPVLSPETLVTFGTEEAKTPEPAAQPGNLGKFLAKVQLQEFESLKAAGFPAAQLPPAQQNAVSGASYLVADGTAGKSVTLEFDVPAGAVTCWVRYSPSASARTVPAGTLAFSLAQDGKPLAEQAVSFATKAEDEPGPDDEMGLDDLLDPDDLLQAEEALTRERTAFRWMPLRATVQQGKVTLTAASEKSVATLDCAVLSADPNYAPDIRDFVGRVWVRWRIDAPAEFRHTAYINSQIYYDFKGAHWEQTGNVGAYGLYTDEKLPLDDGEALAAGQYSPWVLLPTSNFYTWFSIISCKPHAGTRFTGGAATLEFANRPAASRVFHVTAGEPLDLTGAIYLRMPTATTIAGLQGLETFHEWSLRRLAMYKGMNLGPAPHLKRIRIGTWAGLWSRVPKDWLEIDYQIFEGLGINMAAAPEEFFSDFAKAHGIIDTNTIAWGPVDEYKKLYPFASSITTRFNMGDEPGPSIEPKQIEADPAKLADFRTWLKEQKLTPQMLGVTKWEDVYPTEDRRLIGGPKPPPPPMVKQEDIDDPLPTVPDEPGDALNVFKGDVEEKPGPKWETIEAGRLFYYTRRYIDVYSAREWRKGTENVLQFFPNARLISPNYQAGPMQAAFLGNNNDTYRGMIDIFMFTRTGALKGVGMEDWVYGWDAGVLNECLASEMIRSACRKTGGTMSSLLVGGEGIRAELYGYLMHGLKDNDLYMYGPLNNIGPPWGENPRAYAELAEATREIKQFEDPIADGDLRPRRSALLWAYTSEIMQKKGLYFCGLRQSTYGGLKHGYTQADVVCEQEILEDDILKHYDQLFITDSNAPAAVQQKIAEWVKNGGKLWACTGALEWDEFQQYCPVLDPVFGVQRREMTKGEPTKLIADSPLFGGTVELATTDQLLTAEATTAQVVGRYADGKPAVFHNKYGKGEALLVGALVGSAYWRDHYAKDSIKTPGGTYEGGAEAQRLLNAFTTTADRPVACSVPGILTTVMDSPQGSVVFLNNATYSTQAPDPNRPAPQVTVRVKVTTPVTSVESAKFGKLQHQLKDGELTFTLSVPNADIVMVRK
ncbi:MAG: beta-galactosidase trimerization domain-containing protein [Armatimonadota bacterium]